MSFIRSLKLKTDPFCSHIDPLYSNTFTLLSHDLVDPVPIIFSSVYAIVFPSEEISKDHPNQIR